MLEKLAKREGLRMGRARRSRVLGSLCERNRQTALLPSRKDLKRRKIVLNVQSLLRTLLLTLLWSLLCFFSVVRRTVRLPK